jgi:hypothetical protein
MPDKKKKKRVIYSAEKVAERDLERRCFTVAPRLVRVRVNVRRSNDAPDLGGLSET